MRSVVITWLTALWRSPTPPPATWGVVERQPRHVVDPTVSPFILLPETLPLSRLPSPLKMACLASGNTLGAWRESALSLT